MRAPCQSHRSPFPGWLGCLVLAVLVIATPAAARTVEYELTIARAAVNISGRPAQAMTINGSVPGPVLTFREGDQAVIHVHNHMDTPTSIHWHGVLVPPGMDGVPGLSFPGIAPGASFTYRFPIRQSGTYWYHSHSGLQEQSGVYGPLVIHPSQGHLAHPEGVLLLSDWTDLDPHEALRRLKSGDEWFALAKGGAQSLAGAAQLGHLGDYLGRELMRMPAMDIADLAYDRFLVNGAPSARLEAAAGQTLRLRVVNGAASSYFRLQFAGGPLTIVAADGQPVEPIQVDSLLMAVAETYDLLVTPPGPGAWEFRATAHDGSGHGSTWLGDGAPHPAPNLPRPNLYLTMPVDWSRVLAPTPAGSMGMGEAVVASGALDAPGMHGMAMSGDMKMDGDMRMSGAAGEKPSGGGMDMGGGAKMDAGDHANAMHDGMAMSRQTGHATPAMDMAQAGHPAPLPAPGPANAHGADFRPLATDVAHGPALAADGHDPRLPWPPYARLRSPVSTAPAPGRPVRVVRLTLDGDMERYVWMLNNRTLGEEDTIPIMRGEVVRFVMINRTMMHHPMHLHGHFFRVVNGQGDHAPWKHTVDVAPMSTTVIEFAADEYGDWFFHCHLLYHMMAGMARVVHYEGYQADLATQAARPALTHEALYPWAQASILSSMSEGVVSLDHTRHQFSLGWEVGWNHLHAAEWELTGLWDYHLNRFASLLAGADWFGEGYDEDKVRGVAGLRYLLPMNVHSRLWVDSDLGGRLRLDKEFMLTPRLALAGGLEYDTHDLWEGEVGLGYRLTRMVAIEGRWHSDYGWGLGVALRF